MCEKVIRIRHRNSALKCTLRISNMAVNQNQFQNFKECQFASNKILFYIFKIVAIIKFDGIDITYNSVVVT